MMEIPVTVAAKKKTHTQKRKTSSTSGAFPDNCLARNAHLIRVFFALNEVEENVEKRNCQLKLG